MGAEAAVAALRRLLNSRFAPLEESPDLAVAEGWSSMVVKSRREFQWKTWFPGRARTPDQIKRSARKHADMLAYSASAGWERGAPITPEIWDMEMKSLIEDVLCAAFGARFVEPFLRMAVGDLKLWSMREGGHAW